MFGVPILSRAQQKIDVALAQEAQAFLSQNALSVNIVPHGFIGHNELDGIGYQLLTMRHNEFPDGTVLKEIQAPAAFVNVAFGCYLVRELLQGTVKVVNISPLQTGRNFHVNFYFRSKKEKAEEEKTEKKKADYYAAMDKTKGVD